jgi:hypothetical protein
LSPRLCLAMVYRTFVRSVAHTGGGSLSPRGGG